MSMIKGLCAPFIARCREAYITHRLILPRMKKILLMADQRSILYIRCKIRFWNDVVIIVKGFTHDIVKNGEMLFAG